MIKAKIKPPIYMNHFTKKKNLRILSLANGELKDKEFNKCRFVSCNFFKIKFISCEFEDCTFQSCDLSLASVSGSKFLSIYFKGSKTAGLTGGSKKTQHI